MIGVQTCAFLFFFNDTATTEIYTLSLHDALPIWSAFHSKADIETELYEGPLIAEAVEELYFSLGQNIYSHLSDIHSNRYEDFKYFAIPSRSEEHTSELQSRTNLVCRLLLEKKNILIIYLK